MLWGDDGKPLGLVEAKRTKRDARVGQQQAKLYADCLENSSVNGQSSFTRTAISIGSGTTRIIRRARCRVSTRKPSSSCSFSDGRRARSRSPTRRSTSNIVERYYQTRAIRRIAEAFERDHERKALIVMATGAGKTRTVIALCDLLMRCNWAKRVLFLADRVALVNRQSTPSRALCRFIAGKSRDGEGQRRPRLCLDLSDDDGPDRRDAARPATVRGRPFRSCRLSMRRIAPFIRNIGRSSNTSILSWSA